MPPRRHVGLSGGGGGGGHHHGGHHGGGGGWGGGPVWGGYPYPSYSPDVFVVQDEDPLLKQLRELEILERIKKLKKKSLFGLGAVEVHDHRAVAAPDTIFGMPKMVVLVGGLALTAGVVLLLKKKKAKP